MTYATTSINPFYAARQAAVSTRPDAEPAQPVYARLPRAPRNAARCRT